MAKQKKGRAISGIIVIDKPLGLSSNQMLQRVKRLFQAQKAGHTGALDPQASGVLPICLGEATKLSQVLLDADKAYSTTATLGEVRSTGDSEGEVLRTAAVPAFTPEQLQAVIERFTGKIEQVPPMFSALKLNGKPLYELARQGMTQAEQQVIAEKKRRIIEIFELKLANATATSLDLEVRCSKGTYIRTLVEDIGEALGCGAYVSRLHRTACGPFHAQQMYSLEQLEEIAEQGVEALEALLLHPSVAVPNWPQVELSEDEAAKIMQGQAISTGLAPQAQVQLWTVLSGVNTMLGIGRIENGKILVQRLFNLA